MSFHSKPVGIIDYQQGFIRCYQCMAATKKPTITLIKDINTTKIQLCSLYCFEKYKEFDAAMKSLSEKKVGRKTT
jgi:methyl coenzyme M reductase alpha subunit